MMNRLPSNRRPRAFTLVEILMAMAIFGLVMMAIYATWTALLRGSRVGLEAAARVQRERMAIQTFEQALTSARSFAADVQHYGFFAENGSDALLSFVARLPKSFPRSGRFGEFDVRRVAFALESGPDSSRQLVLRQSPLLMEFDPDETDHPLVLARDVKELLFEFWDSRQHEWTDAWDQTNQLPRMIRVTLSLSSPNPTAPATVAMRAIALPAIMVPANWQAPNPQRPPTAPGGPPQPVNPQPVNPQPVNP